MSKKANNTLLGRKCVIDFHCRWATMRQPYGEEQKAHYATRDDWQKTGEIIAYDAAEAKVTVLRDDTGHMTDYYHGEVTVTGAAPDSSAEIIRLLKEISSKLD